MSIVKQDPFMWDDACIDRLKDDYRKHGTLIIAVDFDNTIFDYHAKGYTFPHVIGLLMECMKLGFSIVVYTANEDHKLVQDHCDEIGLMIAGINKQMIPEFGDAGKIYYNILLDDRAGLQSAVYQLEETLNMIREENKCRK